MSKDLAQEIRDTKDALKGKKASYSCLCDTVARYFCPDVDVLQESSDGTETLRAVTSTGELLSQRLQGGLYSNTMAMGKGNIVSPDRSVMELPIAKEWFGELSNKTTHHIAQSEFSSKFQSWLGDYVNFGGSVLYPEWDKVKLQHYFHVYPENSCFYTHDASGHINSMYREFTYTASQAVEQYGEENVGARISDAYRRRDETNAFNFIHCERKRRVRDPKRLDSKNMAYESITVLDDEDGLVVEESGSTQFRYISAHFYQKNGELNGRSPAIQSLQNMRTLTKVVDDFITANELGIGAPIWFNSRNDAETAVLEPFAVNYADLSKGDPWTYRIDPAVLRMNWDLMTSLTEEMERLFFIDLFNMLENLKSRERTKYEVSELVAERSQAIAPIANSLSGFFRDTYKIVALDLVHSQQMEAPPIEVLNADMSDVNLDVQYTSRLDIRLKEIENISLLEAANQAATFAEAISSNEFTQAAVKPIEAILSIFESHNVPPAVVHNKNDANRNLEAMQNAAMEAKQQEMMQGAVKPIDLQAQADEGSAMDQLINQGSGSMVGI